MAWIKGTEIYVHDTNPNNNTAIFVNTYTGAGPSPDVWTEIDLSNIVPEGTKAVHLSGLLIITHGTINEIADLMVRFRSVGAPDNVNYHAQCIEAHIGGGQRSTMSTFVSINEDRKFEFNYSIANPGTSYPQYSAYGINLCVDAFIK